MNKTFVGAPRARYAALAGTMMAVAALTACGGGGGSTPAPTAAPQAAPAAPAPQVAQLSRDDVRRAAQAMLEDARRAQVLGDAALNAYGSYVGLVGIAPQSVACGTHGSAAVDSVDTGATGLPDAGDNVRIQYQLCDASFGTVTNPDLTNGTFTLTWNSANGLPGSGSAWTASVLQQWSTLESTSGTITSQQVDGSMTLAMSGGASASSVVDATLSALTLTDYATLPGMTKMALSELTYDGMTLHYALSATGFDSTISGKTHYRQPSDPSFQAATTTYTTQQALHADANGLLMSGRFTAVVTALRPLSVNGSVVQGGVMLPGSATVVLTIVDSATVRVDVDENSDGALESTFTYAMSEFS